MPLDVTSEIVINRPVSEVAPYAMDPNHAPEWYANIVRVDWKTPPPLAVGSQIAFAARFMGNTLAYTYEVAAMSPLEGLSMRTSEGPFPMETTYAWEPVDTGSTRMTLRNRGAPAGFSRLAGPFMAISVRRANRKDLARLKRLLELTSG